VFRVTKEKRSHMASRVLLAVSLFALLCAAASAAVMNKYNLRKGQEFLKKNAEKEGVVQLPSGLQYKVLTNGEGTVSPKASDSVSVHYRGTLIDGTEFDSSYARSTPANFNVGGVIKGWTEGLQLMHEGDKWELYIPAELAYGEAGAGGKIGANSALIFEVELLSIVNDGAGGPKPPTRRPPHKKKGGAPKEDL